MSWRLWCRLRGWHYLIGQLGQSEWCSDPWTGWACKTCGHRVEARSRADVIHGERFDCAYGFTPYGRQRS